MSGKQFLVTGGTGFIGRQVVRQLLEQTECVRVFCRHHARAQRLFGDRVEIAVGDLREPASVAAACRGVMVVIHLGGVYQFGRTSRTLLRETNLHGTEHLLEAARVSAVERFLHVSSSGVLCRQGALVTEDCFPETVAACEAYRQSKWLGERAALSAARRGLPVIIASPASPIGGGDETPTPTGRIIRDFLRGRFPFAARVALNFIHVSEVASGILAAAAHGRAGERYLLGHHNVWLDDFLRLLARCAGRSAPRRCLRQPVITLAGALGELAGSDRLCWETAAHARRRQWFASGKAREELGWQPTWPLETSVREAVAWFSRQPQPAACPQELPKPHVAAI